MTPGEKKRKELFDLYSKNWIHFSKYLSLPKEFQGKGLYACPMCLTLFDETGLDQSKERRLTLEDVPPKKLGGKPLILTCNTCNNQSGTKYDSHLLNQTRAENFLRRKEGGQKEVVIQINNKSKIKGIAKNLPNDTLGIHFINKSNPMAQPDIDHLFKNWNSGQFKLDIKGGNPKLFNIAKLRIAYLLAFAKFGYGYIMNWQTQIIRSQLSNPNDAIIEHLGIVKLNFEEDISGIFLVKHPKNIVGFLALFDLMESGHKSKVAVLLPGLHKTDETLYDELKRSSEIGKIDFSNIRDLDYLTDESLCIAPIKFSEMAYSTGI
ncbi:hypothetical protein [Reichenbachiella sp.]